MDNKAKNIFMACVGGYLMYTGYNLVVDVMSKEPENKTVFLIAGAVFAVIGLATIIMNLREFFKDFKKEVFETEETLEDVEDTEMNEEIERHNHVEIIDIMSEDDSVEAEEMMETDEEEAEELEEELEEE